MAEFKLKTTAAQDTTLHATYPDLYDGTAPYLKVGGEYEPKKALLRFNVADKPLYGDATLKGAEIGFYSTGVTGSQGGLPSFNIYKLKTGPNDANAWSGAGRIRTVPRGKQIVGLDVSANTVKVLGHGLNTGERVWHSPYTDQYSDVKLNGITPEIEYYVIRVDTVSYTHLTLPTIYSV